MASEQLLIEDGLKVYDLANKDGKVYGQIVFNPSDTNIVKRYEDSLNGIQKIISMIEEPKYKEKMNSKNPFSDIDPMVYKNVNDLLGNDQAADLIFSVCGPFSPLPSGQFYIESVYLAIGQVIEKETGTRLKKINSKVKKYTGKYHA